MSSAINYVQNSVSIPRYNRQQQINIAERQISQIDRTIEKNNRTIALNNEQNAIRRELIANNDEFQKIGGKLLAVLEENQALRTEHLKTLKESRDAGQRIVDKSEQLLACYEKLLEIRRAKNASNNSGVVTPQKFKTSVSSGISPNHSVSSMKHKVIKEQSHYQSAPAIKSSIPVDLKAVNADATKQLGDVLFDHYEGTNKALAMNIRDRFYQELEYDTNKNTISINSNLEKVFSTFANYLKIRDYSYFKDHASHFLDLQNRLMKFDAWC